MCTWSATCTGTPRRARAGDGADALICLGDLVLFLDYADHSRGIFPDLFGVDNADRIVELRTARRFDEARALRPFDSGPACTAATRRSLSAVRKQYAEMFAVLPTPTYATYGNVDVPTLWPEYANSGTTVLDGERVEIGGRVFGFVGGGLATPMNTPYEISDDEYAAKVEALGPVDVLCSHIPPEVPELTYDTVARRFERGSRALLDAIHPHPPPLRDFRPRPPAAGPQDADRRHRVRQRRTLRLQRAALGPGVVTTPPVATRPPGTGRGADGRATGTR